MRLAVLTALHQLYGASSENLALMDTFNARFILRVQEMVNDVDPGRAVVQVDSIKTRGDMTAPMDSTLEIITS